MKCKKENINELIDSTVWYLDDDNHPRQGVITEAIYDEGRNDVIVTIQKDTPGWKMVRTERYLSRHCYKTLDDLFDHMVNASDADLQKIANKIKDDLKHEVFSGENSVALHYQLAYILLDYYANKQLKQYCEAEIIVKIRETIVHELNTAIDKICNDIK